MRMARSSFEAEQSGERVTFRSYDGVPAVVACSNGRYTHEPTWYRNFFYSEEQARGLDAVEDLASPGIFEFSLSQKPAVLMLAAEVVAGVGDPGSPNPPASTPPAQGPPKRVMPSSGRSKKPAGNISPVRSNVPPMHISLNAAKEKLSLPVTRGLAIGDATRLSRCADCASQPGISKKRATFCCNGLTLFHKACCQIDFPIKASNRSLIRSMRRFGTSLR